MTKDTFLKTTQELSGDWGEWVKMQRTDHDTLIRVETMMSSMALDIKDLKDGTTTKLVEHESRIRAMEKLADEYAPKPLVDQLKTNTNDIRDMKTSKNAVFYVASIVGGAIAFILMVISNLLGILDFRR